MQARIMGLSRRKASNLDSVTLYSDIDMAFEQIPPATAPAPILEEARQLARKHGVQHKSKTLDMDFMPAKVTEPNGLKWHSTGPTQSDITTRPHRSLAKELVQS
jgi:hypothetical protein